MTRSNSLTVDTPEGSDAPNDPVTVALHWIVALLVLNQFALSIAWRHIPRGPGAALLQHTHVSLGLVLFAALVASTAWTATRRRKPSRGGDRLQTLAAAVVHRAFVVLILAQAVLGMSKRWVRGRAVEVFGFAGLPTPIHIPARLQPALDAAHRLNADLIMLLVAGHVGAALLHHYVLHDGVLRRMIPALRERPA